MLINLFIFFNNIIISILSFFKLIFIFCIFFIKFFSLSSNFFNFSNIKIIYKTLVFLSNNLARFNLNYSNFFLSYILSWLIRNRVCYYYNLFILFLLFLIIFYYLLILKYSIIFKFLIIIIYFDITFCVILRR